MSNIPSSLQKELIEWLANSTTNNKTTNKSEEDRQKKEPVEKILHRIATENRNLYHDKKKNAYVEVQDEKQFQAINKYLVKIRSEEFNEWITHECYTNYYKTPTNQQLKGLKRVVTREAQLNGQKIELFNRVASISKDIYVDLGTVNRDMVKVDAAGWQIGNYPVYFERYPHMEELPKPVKGGDIKEILYFLPPLSKQDECLVLSWMVSSFVEHIERPFLLLEGPAGSGKTTLGLILKSFIDPMQNAALSYNENENEVAQIIDHQYLPFIDNITSITRKLSDLICRAFSGGSHLKKELYTDEKDFILNLSGSIIFSAIRLMKPKGDFLDRCYKVIIEKTELSSRSREEFGKKFEEAKPRIFGALLDTLSATLAKVNSIPITGNYRTVDFDRYATAAAEVMGYGAVFFLEARRLSEQIKKESITNSTPIIEALSNFLKSNNNFFLGKMSKVMEQLPLHSSSPTELPKEPQVLSRRINELQSEMNAAGITATRKPNNSKGSIWEFRFINTSMPSDMQEIHKDEQKPGEVGFDALTHQENGLSSPFEISEDGLHPDFYPLLSEFNDTISLENTDIVDISDDFLQMFNEVLKKY